MTAPSVREALERLISEQYHTGGNPGCALCDAIDNARAALAALSMNGAPDA